MQNNDPGLGGKAAPVQYKKRFSVAVLSAAVTLGWGLSNPAQAFEFSYGGLNGSFDTTLSYGTLVRVDKPDQALIGIANGGTARTVNGDDGNLNYDRLDFVSSLFKGTHDLELKYDNYGLFVRATEFYDTQVATDRDRLGPRGRDRLQTGFEFRDAFLSGRWKPFDRSLTARVGFQVLNWGESTFIQNGLSVINPFDVNKLRTPGSEIKEALLASPLLWVSQQLNSDLSVEGFVQARFDNVLIDPTGSYFSTNDIAGDDGNRAILSFGRRKDRGPLTNPIPPSSVVGPTARALAGPFDPAASVYITRNADRSPNGLGQFGVATHYLANWLGSTEFGAYYLDYHSRLPLVSVVKSTSPLPGSGSTTALTGTPLGAPTGQNGSARYFLEYPEDIHLFGLSFNTLAPFGIALQGEYTYRPNLPVQLSATELVLAAVNLPSNIAPVPSTIAPGSEIRGYRRVDAHQIQFTATKAIPSVLKANQLVLLTEIGYNNLNLPKNLAFDGPGTSLPQRQDAANAASGGSVQQTGYATRNSWGYRFVGRLDYLSLIGPINVSPRVVFSHDVKGVGPNFNEGTQAATIGFNFEYQRVYQADFSYTSFFGGRNYCGTDNPALSAATLLAGQSLNYCTSANPLRDRDFLSFNVSYSF
jgi:hypothetical protein